MTDKLCASCRTYLRTVAPGIYDYIPETHQSRDCTFHPSLTSNRVRRTLNTLKLWSLEAPGYVHRMCKIAPLVRDGCLVHRRTAEAILFHYEAPFIDLLLHERLLIAEDHGQGSVLRVSAIGDQKIREWQKEMRDDA